MLKFVSSDKGRTHEN